MHQYWQYIKKYIKPEQVKVVLTWLLMLALLFQLAQITWAVVERFVPQPQPIKKQPISAKKSTSSQQQQQQVNTQQIANLHLFGEVQQQVAEVVEEPETDVINPDEAQETQLNLTLKGVYATEDPEMASAVVEYSNDQKAYRIGDNLPGGPNIILRKVMPTRILFERNGNLESLSMESFALDIADKAPKATSLNRTSTVRSSATRRRTLDKRRDRELTQKLQQMKQQLNEKGIESFRELVSVSPVRGKEGLEGFRVSPGKDRRLFTRFGFYRGDVIKEVNGVQLNDPSRAFELMNMLNSAQDLSIVVKRGSAELELQFSLSDVNSSNSLNRKKEAM